MLIKQFNLRLKPRQILKYLNSNYIDDLTLAQDIYNTIKQICKERRGGQSYIKTFLIKL